MCRIFQGFGSDVIQFCKVASGNMKKHFFVAPMTEFIDDFKKEQVLFV